METVVSEREALLRIAELFELEWNEADLFQRMSWAQVWAILVAAGLAE